MQKVPYVDIEQLIRFAEHKKFRDKPTSSTRLPFHEESSSTFCRATVYAALNNKGTAALVTVDDRSYANNPFQRHFQYTHDLALSPEYIFEVGNIQGGQSGQTTTSEYSYTLHQ